MIGFLSLRRLLTPVTPHETPFAPSPLGWEIKGPGEGQQWQHNVNQTLGTVPDSKFHDSQGRGLGLPVSQMKPNGWGTRQTHGKRSARYRSAGCGARDIKHWMDSRPEHDNPEATKDLVRVMTAISIQ